MKASEIEVGGVYVGGDVLGFPKRVLWIAENRITLGWRFVYPGRPASFGNDYDDAMSLFARWAVARVEGEGRK